MAIDELLDEHEQGERVLAWLRRNGAALIGGIALGLGAIYGWGWWQARQVDQAGALSTQYQAALSAIEAKTADAGRKVAALPAGSSYRTLAALHLAGMHVDAGQRDAALATLRGAKAADPALQAVIDGRVARLLIDAKQAPAALTLLASAKSATAAEIRGDAHLALAQRPQARQAYEEALRLLDIASPSRRLLELKLTEVGGTPATPEAKS